MMALNLFISTLFSAVGLAAYRVVKSLFCLTLPVYSSIMNASYFSGCNKFFLLHR